jgi:Carboxypeptidase regulatory-like domain
MLPAKTVGKLAISALALPFFATSAAHAQGTILNATVADAETGIYILDAEVTVDPVGLKAITDYFGDARFPGLRKGRYTVRARRLGFAPLSAEVAVSGQDSLDVTLLMASTTHKLADVTVEADATSPFLREFEERRRQDKGQYITDSVLRASFGIPLEDILTARLRGIMVMRQSDGSFIPVSTRGHNNFNGPCAISVYWDGVRITNWQSHSVDIPAAFIGGIEFYNPGTIPARYQDLGSGCGVLLLWPRP